jgi:succinate dehydrogenase/fumarate reductase flavoprotein subunit
MPQKEVESISSDVLIIGAGGAGMRAAIAAAEKGVNVALATKGQAARSGATPMACPSYQASFSSMAEGDSADIAFEDTCYEGRYLGDENLISALVNNAADRALDLMNYGIKFRKMDDGKFLQVMHPGQTYARNLVIMGNGYAMAAGLRRQMLKYENIRLIEDVVITRLLKDGDCMGGGIGLNLRSGRPLVIKAPAVILATGGYQELWRWTDTEPGLTGEGVHMAYEAGADLIDMEMMLFYPAGLCYPTEVEGTLVQYEGLLTDEYCHGRMINGLGDPFLPETDRLPVRDVMMKLMFREIEEGRGTQHGGVYIDLRESPRSKDEIRDILKRLDSLPYNQLRDLGIDITNEPIEVKPVTHFTLGGVRINEWAETNIPGLFAAGEISGNLHGANRTSGNALAETQVFGLRAGERAAEYAQSSTKVAVDKAVIANESKNIYSFLRDLPEGIRPIEVKRKIKAIMHNHVHYRRSKKGLLEAVEELRELREDDIPRMCVIDGPRIYNYEWEEALEVIHMIDLAEIVAATAIKREETRGHHWREDFPKTEKSWEKHTIARRSGDGYSIEDAPIVRLKDRVIKRRKADPALVAAGVLDNGTEG